MKSALREINTRGLLAVIIILAAVCFGLFFFKDQFFFYYDQGRDAYEAYSIYHDKDLKIQGPSSDIPGVYHGVGWYYFLTLPYLLGRGDPFFAGLFLFIIVFSTIPFVWYLTYSIFKNSLIANGVIILYSFSPAFQLASRWLSNPSLAFIIVPLLLFILWKFVEKQDSKKSFLIGILYGSLLHANIAYLICIISLPLIYLVFRIKPKLSEILFTITGLFIALIPFFLVEIKFKGKGFNSIIGYLRTNSSSFDFDQFIKTLVVKLNELFDFTMFGTGSIIMFIIVSLFFIFTIKKIKPSEKKPLYFILVWISTLVLFFLFETGFTKGKYVFFPYLLPAVILLVFMLRKVIINKIFFALVLLILIILQLNSNLRLIRTKSNPYTVQNGMVLSDLKKAVDYTYNQSDKKAFAINSVTNPLYINTTWAYLYEFYGARKYGYLPKWDGKDQEGYLGNIPEGTKAPFRFTIIEPGPGIPEIFIKETIQEEDVKSQLVSEERFGSIIVQKRIPKE